MIYRTAREADERAGWTTTKPSWFATTSAGPVLSAGERDTGDGIFGWADCSSGVDDRHIDQTA